MASNGGTELLAERYIRLLWPRRHDSDHVRDALRHLIGELRLWRQVFQQQPFGEKPDDL